MDIQKKQVKKEESHIIFRNAQIIQNKTINQLQYLKNKAIIIDQKGVIIQIIDDNDENLKDYLLSSKIITLSNKNILIPGLIDTHVHAPQFMFTGTGYDLPLLEWLKKYTFPCESRFKDLALAEQVYKKSIRSHIRNGTTTICYFATIHEKATSLLADLVQQSGARGFVGKVCMDRNAPEWYLEESVEKSIEDTIEFINYLKKKESNIVPVITPRFAITSTSKQLIELGKLAQKYDNMLIQTHLSENKNEIQFVKELFPECQSYTDVYFKHGLLTKKTILAHSIYLSNEEIAMIKKAGSGISFCPISNTNLSSGIMPVRKYIDEGLKIGLGSDVAGGYTTSMFSVIRQSMEVSKLRSLYENCQEQITLAEAFYLATMGGAEVLGMEEEIGTIEVGKQFDALIINYEKIQDAYFSEEIVIEDIFEKIIYLANPECIEQRWCRGQLINIEN